MDRTKKAFIEAQKKGLIKMVNRQIRSISLEGCGSHLEIHINLYPMHNQIDTIKLGINEMQLFIHLFECDNDIDVSNWWSTDDLVNRYIRVCYYLTPDNEMHELADKEEYVGCKHILDDDPECYYTFIDKYRVNR